MDYYNNLELPFNFKNLDYQRVPDLQFDISNNSLLGEMYNDKIDNGKHDLSHLNLDKWKNFAWSVYKLSPGKWVPPHVDHFGNYSKFYNIKNKNTVRRKLIFLENWKPGHFFILKGKVYTNWRANDYATWTNEDSHCGGNFGSEDRYTIQLTGSI